MIKTLRYSEFVEKLVQSNSDLCTAATYACTFTQSASGKQVTIAYIEAQNYVVE